MNTQSASRLNRWDFLSRHHHSLWLRYFLLGAFFCLNVLSLRGAAVNVAYNSASHIPITASSYTATGNTISFALNFAPPVGTSLTVIRNTGMNFINGEFDNLKHGQQVVISYNGQSYYFIANYYGYSRRDLVLQWANVKPIAWGDGISGQLGNNATDDALTPVAVKTNDALWGKVVFSGAAGGSHSLAVTADGSAVSWGLNTNGQLGNSSTTASNVPVGISIPGVPATRHVVAVAAGLSHSLALLSDGKVVAWGLNTNGQLGDGTNTQRTSPVNVSVAGLLSSRTVVAIAAGSSHSLALCSDGTVATWGLNTNGQLGNSSTSESNVPVAVTTVSSALSGKNVVAIAAGGNHSLALCLDGTIAAWGLNGNGQLGIGGTASQNKPFAVSTAGVLNGKFVTMIAGGGSHSVALCADGAITAWGLNTSGQLGNGNNSQSSVPLVVTSSGALNGKTVFMISAGISHSMAHCSDSTVATWGVNSNGELGNNNTTGSNVPVTVDSSALQTGGISAVLSGPTAQHTLGLFAAPEIELNHCDVRKTITYSQMSTANPVLDADSPYNFTSYVNAGTMGNLLASSTLTTAVGGTGAGVFETGTMGLWMLKTFRTRAQLDAAFPTGSYQIALRTSTPNTYSFSLAFGIDDYPAIPKITIGTNATWNNGALKIMDPTQDTVLQLHNPNGVDAWFQVENSNVQSNTASPFTSFTIPGNSLTNNSEFRAAVVLMKNSNSVAIPGLPSSYASSAYETRVRFVIQVGIPVSSEPTMYLLVKSHNQVQSSNNDPADAPNALPDSDLAPYAVVAESPVGGTLSGPSATSFPLTFSPSGDGVAFEYFSDSATSPAALNATYPNGNYTFPGNIVVSLPADDYPATAKILTVNGTTPVWNAQGQLALDPTIDNTIVWSNVNVPNFSNVGHQTVEFQNYNDYNFGSIEAERGILTEFETPITSLLIPKASMTPTFTYIGVIGYATAPTLYEPVLGTYAVSIYEASNQFMAVALKPQTILFPTITPKLFPSASFALGASVASGLPITYEVISGPATLSGSTLSLVGVGSVTVRASQAGNGVYSSAVSETQTFTVTYATALAQFRATYGLATDGSQDLQTPANDGVNNLLKYAFNMMGSGTGQKTLLTTPNVQIVGLTGNAGLPRQGSNAGKLSITYIRRQASSTLGITYVVEFASALSPGSWGVNGSAVETIQGIDGTFERVTVTDHAVFTTRFARVRVSK